MTLEFEYTWFLRNGLMGSSVIAVGLICIAFWFVASVFSRLYLHDLRSLPGPLLGRVTSWYSTLHIYKKTEARNFHHLHEKLGPVVRYGPNHVSIRSAEAVRMLYTNSRYTRKAESYMAFPRLPEKASLFSCIDKQVHARKRRLLRYGFSDMALKDSEVVIKKHVATFCRCLQFLGGDDGEGHTVEQYWDRQDQGKLMIGGDVDGWSAPKNYATWVNRRNITDIVHDSMWAENVTGSCPTLLQKWQLKWPLVYKWILSYRPFDEFIEGAAKLRLQEGSKNKKDFVFWLTNTGEENKADDEDFSMEELMEEVILLITAGGDTSSTTICSCMYYLMHSPEKFARLQAEVLAAFPSVHDIGLNAALHSCTYLRACIDEALRMAPPAGSVLRREVEKGGVIIHDIHFPEGTNIGVPVFSIHHDPAYFPAPFTYQPERWIVGETLQDGVTHVTPEFVKRAQGAFLPFSAGTRGCIGKPLAYLAISILYATLAHRFDIRLCPSRWVNGRKHGEGPDPTTEYDLEDIFTTWKNGPLIQVRSRS